MKKSNKSIKAAVSIFTSVAVVISIMAPVLTLAPQLAYAAPMGPNNGSAFTNDSTVGTINWSNPDRAETSNDSRAEVDLDDWEISRYLKATDFGFSIPTGATINGIKVDVERQAENLSRIKDSSVRILKGGSIGTENKANTVDFWGTSDAYVSYGSTTDLWGQSWTPADINALNFGFVFSAIKASNQDGHREARVDHIRITVYYTPLVCTDADQDTYYAEGGQCGPIDCNDNDASINPDAVETCDGIDNNCEGRIDEGLTRPTTCGTGICSGNTGTETCVMGIWGANTCDPFKGISLEICGNQIDEDCNGSDLACSLFTCAVTAGGVTCDNHLYEDYCEFSPTEGAFANVRFCNALEGPSCGGLVNITRTSCNDQNVCTTDSCGSGQCAHADVTCFDNDPCTDDSCDPISGCVFTPNDQCGPTGTSGYCGMYFNQVPNGVDFEKLFYTPGVVTGDNPFNHPNWWDIAKLAFVQTDSALNFGDNFLPVDQGLTGDPFHFTANWQAKLIVSAEGDYGYSLRSDDDSWLYVDGTMSVDLGGVHAPTTRTGSIHLTQGEHTFNLYFAERHTTQSYLDFHWTTSGIEVLAECEPYCGDQICNGEEDCGSCSQDCGTCPEAECGNDIKEGDEQCDGQDGVTEHYTCTKECTLEYVPYCGDQTCDEGETCINCSDDCGLCPCDPNQELITNGGFETPEVTHPALWDIFNSSNGLTGWSVQWESLQAIFNEIARPITAFLELQKGAAGDPEEGLQLAELDADWFGPDNSMNGEPASVRIYQDLTTIPGQQYAISFYFSPRPNTILENNKLEFSWDGSVIDNNIEGAGENNTNWVKKEYTLTAIGATTRIEFADLGNPDSLGTYLDNVSVRCRQDEPVCVSSPEICSDGIDNDCDQAIDCADEDCIQATNCIPIVGCQPGATESCSTGLYGICAAGTRICGERAVWGECIQNNEPSTEICDQIDNDCDDAVDEDLICTGNINTVITGGGGGGGGHLVVCGDGITEFTELCDDGNTIDGDGCSSTCGVELVLGASTEQGEVLGESTTIPETGEDAVMLIISSIIVALGAGLGLRKKLAVK